MNDQSSGWRARFGTETAEGTLLGGRYAIERVIARGGMATVYLAQDTLLNRPVALKLLTGDTDAGERDAFLSEARAVAQLSHPNIVEVYDAGVEGASRYIVMQYVPGDTLRDVIAREAPLDPRRAVELAIRLADALDYGHRRGIIHCDVKPGNVLLGDHGEPKIVDFGIAHNVAATTRELAGTVAGTVGYIAPEQLDPGSPEPDGRTDVYSLAAVLYEMLCGAPPYSGVSLAAIAAQRLTKPPAPLRERNPFVPEELDAIVMRGLAIDPAQRPPSAHAFAEDLRGYLGGLLDERTRRSRRPRPAQDEIDGHTERVGVTRRRTAGGPARAGRATAAPRRSPWLFLTLAGLLAAVLTALIVFLAAGLFDLGGGTAAVPATTGERVDTAARLIHDAGLKVGEVRLTANPAPHGTVIDQNPPAAQRLAHASRVDLVVSLGPEAP
jgi:predicted Ser/Thr protein kinase